MVNEKDFKMDKKRGRKPKLYMVLDCETATLPFVKEWDLTAQQKQKISIAKPIIYDLGWRIVDRNANVYSQHSFLIQETFFVPTIFNTAYYSWKRPLYMERFQSGEIIVKTWEQAVQILIEDLERVEFATAYNAMFDFKKAIPFTETYIEKLYSSDYNEWETAQRRICQNILKKTPWENPEEFDNMNFTLREKDYPISDLWGLACNRLINQKKYKEKCLELSMISASGLFFKTSAEATFRYLVDSYDFEEEHTALNDAIIETEILRKALKKGKIDPGIQYFPFKELGETVDYITKEANPKKLDTDMVENVIKTMWEKLSEYNSYSSFASQLEKKLIQLETFLDYNFGYMHEYIICYCTCSQLEKVLKRKKNYIKNLKPDGEAYQKTKAEIVELEIQIEEMKKILKNY